MYTSADSIPKEVTRLMAQLFHRSMPVWWRKYCFLFLAFCWIAGLVSGASACLAAGDSLNSLMRGAAARPVSIVSLLGVTMFPFLLSAFAAASDREPWGCVRAFLCFSRRDAVRRLRRMACPVASRFQCQPCFAAYVPVLAAAPDGAQAL